MAGVAEALPRACSQCPWRLANQGQPHPHGFYSAANLRRLWNGLRTAEAPGMTCHPTDPSMADFAGYERTADSRRTHECAGSIILLVREVMRFQAVTFEVDAEAAAGAKLRRDEALRRYRQRAPRGLTRGGLAEIVWRFMVGGTPLARSIRADSRMVNDSDVGYAPLGTWDPGVLKAAMRR